MKTQKSFLNLGEHSAQDTLRWWCEKGEMRSTLGLVLIGLVPVLLSVFQWYLSWIGVSNSDQLAQLTKTLWFGWLLVTIIVGRRVMDLLKAMALEVFRLRQQILQLEAKIQRNEPEAQYDEALESN